MLKRRRRSRSSSWTLPWTRLFPPTRKSRSSGAFRAHRRSVWIQDPAGGYLLFSDCAANVIYKWMAGKPLSVYLEKSGYTGTDTLNVGQQTIAGRLAILLIGSNGLALDPQGRLIITQMADRTVTRLEKDGKRTLLADRYEGKRLSGPCTHLFKVRLKAAAR